LVALLFSAIPTALLFRTLAARRTPDAALVEMVGRFTLFAFALAILACWVGAAIGNRLARWKQYNALASQSDVRTIVLENSGISLTSQTSQSTLQWSAITGFSVKGELFLLWISQVSGIAIPARSLGDDAARLAAQAFIRARLAEVRPRAGSAASTRPPPD
jgi:hypothetical protein